MQASELLEEVFGKSGEGISLMSDTRQLHWVVSRQGWSDSRLGKKSIGLMGTRNVFTINSQGKEEQFRSKGRCCGSVMKNEKWE